MTVATALKKVAAGQNLTLEESEKTFQAIMNGAADNQAQIGALLACLHMKGETADEIAGAARVLRAKSATFNAPEGTVDLCGTGGDGLNTLNISTAAAFVVAACGVPVAKHGNRAVSSACGSADVLEALGIQINIEPEKMEQCLAETNFAFLFAPLYHSAMRAVADIRRQLGFRTIFNLVGPLANPANVKRQLIGVSSEALVPVFVDVAKHLGLEYVMVAHGGDGMDEISVTAEKNLVQSFRGLEDWDSIIGASRHSIEAIEGGDANHNATAIRNLFNGDGSGAFAEAVRINAAAALVVSGKYPDFAEAFAKTKEVIENCNVSGVLTRVIEVTNQDEHT